MRTTNPVDMLPLTVEIPQGKKRATTPEERIVAFRQRNLGTFKFDEASKTEPDLNDIEI